MLQKYFIFFDILLIITLTHPFQKFLTIIHKYGHCLHLHISGIILKQIHSKPKPKITKHKQLLFFRMYQGRTDSSLYKYFEIKKKYGYIKANAISGSLFVIIIISIPFALILIFCKELQWTPLITYIPLVSLELFNFFTSSDFKYFINPKSFHYKGKRKKRRWH